MKNPRTIMCYVLQGIFDGKQWDDITFYDVGKDEARLRDDKKSYIENDPRPYRVIKRRIPNPNWIDDRGDRLKNAVKAELKKDLEYCLISALDPCDAKSRRSNLEVLVSRRVVEKYDKKQLSEEEIAAEAKKGFGRTFAREYKKECAKIDRILSAPKFTGGDTIEVIWKRSGTFGWNPHATYNDRHKIYRSSASGCGFDKLSQAVAGVLNQSDSLMRELYLYKADHMKKGMQNTEIFGIGVGNGALPYFADGYIEKFPEVFHKIGYEFAHTVSTDTVDVFDIRFKKWFLP